MRAFAALTGLLFAGVTACATSGPAKEAEVPSGRVALRVVGLEGEILNVGRLRGRVVLLTVITTWSDVALAEAPRLNRLASRYPEEDLAVVCVALDDNVEMAAIFRDTFELGYFVGTVEDRAGFTGERGPFGPIGLIPTSVLLDRQGRIVARMDGAWAPGVLEQAVERLVARP